MYVLYSCNEVLVFWLTRAGIAVAILLDPLVKKIRGTLGNEDGGRDRVGSFGRRLHRHQLNRLRLVLEAVDDVLMADRKLELEIESGRTFRDILLPCGNASAGLLDCIVDRLFEPSRMRGARSRGRQSLDWKPWRCVTFALSTSLEMDVWSVARRACHSSSAKGYRTAFFRSLRAKTNAIVVTLLCSPNTATLAASSAAREISACDRPAAAFSTSLHDIRSIE